MRVSDIYEEVKEASGTTDETRNFRLLTRAIEELANKGLFDPLIGTMDYFVDGSYLIALPRNVKTPIRLNINNNPSFARTRLFEFMPNTDGSNDGEEVNWQWHERGYSPIQDERYLPSKLTYEVTNIGDIGKTARVLGIDGSGREVDQVIVGAMTALQSSEFAFSEVVSVVRDGTVGEAWLRADGGPIGRYYGDETQPEFRVIKLSKTGVAVRMIYRKHVFRITSQEDIIPLHSSSAVILAVAALESRRRKQYDEATAALAEAEKIIKEEQGTRIEGATISQTLDIQSAINQNINTNDVLIVADIYDFASELLGGIGRLKVFDRITDGINALQNKSQWDSALGWCDLWPAANCADLCRPKDGIFVLPRYVAAVNAMNVSGRPAIARNRWFEYHLNGPGEGHWSSCGTWDDVGDTCIINMLPRDENCKTIPTRVLAIPDNALDNDTEIRIFGIERLSTGRDAEVWRDGVKGWLCPCKLGDYDLPPGSPAFVQFHDISKAESQGFIKLVGFPVETTNIALIGDVGYVDPTTLAVEQMIKSRNVSDVILLGDLNYGQLEEIEEVGISDTNTVDIGEIVIRHLTGTTPIAPGQILRINDHYLDVTGVVTQSPLFPPAEDSADTVTFSNPNSVLIPQGSAVFLVTQVGSIPSETIQGNIGSHWRKFIYPFVGTAQLRAGEVDATENHAWPVIGNHDDPLTGLQAHLDFFVLPNNERYYTKVFGDVEVFFINSEPEEPDGRAVGSVQYEWIRAKILASTAKWKVCCFHRNPHSSGSRHGISETMAAWPFAEMGVNAVFAGHEHNYERIEKDGVLYFVVGTGGPDLNGLSSDPNNLDPDSKAFHEVNGALFMEATEFDITFTFRNTAGDILDTRTLTATVVTPCELLLGYWYPDETRPRYRMVKVPGCNNKRLRIRYRKRTFKVTGLHDVINLRSRLALENMLAGLAMQHKDAKNAELMEARAVKYLDEEQRTHNPIVAGGLQFDPGTSPGHTRNIH